MAYHKKDNLDLNHYPSSQDLRKQRVVMLALTPCWLVLTMSNMSDPARSDLSRSGTKAVFLLHYGEWWRLFVRIVNGCEINDHFWVFAAVVPTAEVTVLAFDHSLTVTDSTTGATWGYAVLGTDRVPDPVVDTQAFSTCP